MLPWTEMKHTDVFFFYYMGYINSPLGVKDTSLLEDLSNNGDGRVDRVGNDQDVRLGAVP